MTKLQDKFKATRAELAATLIERDDEIDCALTALVAREHLLLVGPPGAAKSLLLDSLLGWLGGQKFNLLLTKFTEPDEVFGPLNVPLLLEGKRLRVTAGKLAEADWAFLDEVFRGNSAVLNALLKVMNERRYDPGDGERAVPLKLLVGAANDWPDPETGARELGALFDRFLVRKEVRPIRSAAGRARLLWGKDHTPKLSTRLTPDELAAAAAEAAGLPWSREAKAALTDAIDALAKAGVRPGDRRQYKAVKAVQAYAYVFGAEEVLPDHLELAAHVLWDDPQQAKAAADVIARTANPAAAEATELLLQADAVVAGCDPADEKQSIPAIKKLKAILTDLKKLDGVKARAAADAVDAQMKRIRLAALGEVMA